MHFNTDHATYCYLRLSAVNARDLHIGVGAAKCNACTYLHRHAIVFADASPRSFMPTPGLSRHTHVSDLYVCRDDHLRQEAVTALAERPPTRVH